MIKNKIDFVLPWVDPSDPSWQEERMKHDKDFNKEDKGTVTRFRDMNTLKYVLRSIEQHCSWYHKIYLITTGHYPQWLDINHPKIELIVHEKLFIDKDALPVFNSNAIEMNLVNIKGLSEKLIYLNDDMVIWNTLNTNRFFKNGKAIDFFHHAWIPRNKMFEWIKGSDTWVDAINNNIKLINNSLSISKMNKKHLYHTSYGTKHKISNFLYKNVYKKLFWINHWHHPQAYRRHTIEEVYRNFTEILLETSRHKFRSSKDVTPYLYRYWHLVSGDFEPYFHNDGMVAKISSLKYLESIINELDQNKSINFVCFNDQANMVDENDFLEMSQRLEEYLETRFSIKASFEIDG